VEKLNYPLMGETISYLKDIVQVKVNNVVYIINIESKDRGNKQINTVPTPIATTAWDKLSACYIHLSTIILFA
jgi:hypothetical protein